MDGKDFFNIVKSVNELKVNGINIFLKLDNDELTELKYNYQEEKKFIEDVIIEEIKKYENKKPKLYDTCKTNDEFFYININYLPEAEDLIKSLEKIENKKVISECKKHPEKIKYVIIEILTENESIFFILDYEYNQFFKKKVLGAVLGETFEVKATSSKNLIINFSPKIIKYKDELIFTTTTPNLLNVKNIFKKCIDSNINLVSSVINITTRDDLNKEISILLGRGILNGELDKFNNFSDTDKSIKITEFKSKYKDKYHKQSNVIYSNEKIINFHSLDATEKQEIIKLITNRSALKILDGVLTTSLD